MKNRAACHTHSKRMTALRASHARLRDTTSRADKKGHRTRDTPVIAQCFTDVAMLYLYMNKSTGRIHRGRPAPLMDHVSVSPRTSPSTPDDTRVSRTRRVPFKFSSTPRDKGTSRAHGTLIVFQLPERLWVAILFIRKTQMFSQQFIARSLLHCRVPYSTFHAHRG